VTTLERLFSLETVGIKLGLENIRSLTAALGHPERACPSVHVAGTNGKGSVSAMVERALRAQGYRTGLYTSPHLDRVEERIAINGIPIAPEPFDQDGQRVICYPGDPRHSQDVPAWPGPTRLTFRNRRFEPEGGLDALLSRHW